MYFTSSWNQNDLVSAKLCNSFKALPPLDLKGHGAEFVPLSPVRARDLEEARPSHPARRILHLDHEHIHLVTQIESENSWQASKIWHFKRLP